jgi:hypothetical protein
MISFVRNTIVLLNYFTLLSVCKSLSTFLFFLAIQSKMQKRTIWIISVTVGVICAGALAGGLAYHFTRPENIPVVEADPNATAAFDLLKYGQVEEFEASVRIDKTFRVDEPNSTLYFLTIDAGEEGFPQEGSVTYYLTEFSSSTLDTAGETLAVPNVQNNETFPYQLPDDFDPGAWNGGLFVDSSQVVIGSNAFEVDLVPGAETTPSPTDSETDSPTSAPTVSQTEAPTVVPTLVTTMSPTQVPAQSPSRAPVTASPSIIPVPGSTPEPSIMPVTESTPEPTERTSPSPTRSPTPVPVAPPTSNPTLSPTPRPAPQPTNLPPATPVLYADLVGHQDYYYEGRITFGTRNDVVNGQVVQVVFLQFQDIVTSSAPGPALYLSKNALDVGGSLPSDAIRINIEGVSGGEFVKDGNYVQDLDFDIDLVQYTNGAFIAWCEPFEAYLGGGQIN